MLWRLFSAGVKVNHRSIYSRILAGVRAVAMTTGLIKNMAYKWFLSIFKKIQSLDFFHRLPTTN